MVATVVDGGGWAFTAGRVALHGGTRGARIGPAAAPVRGSSKVPSTSPAGARWRRACRARTPRSIFRVIVFVLLHSVQLHRRGWCGVSRAPDRTTCPSISILHTGRTNSVQPVRV